MNYRDIDIFGYSFGGEVLKRVSALGDEVREAYNRLIEAGFPSSTAEKIATGELPMDSASKAARMKEQGFAERPYYFGTPDVRGIREQGGFSERTMNAYNRDSGAFEEVPQATYLSPDRNLASTYADPMRAWDYQGAEPEVMALRMRGGNLLEINAGGKKFNQVPLSNIRAQIPEERLEEFDAIIARHADPALAKDGKIRTGDLEIVAGKLGYDGFRIKNVIDTYSGKGRPSEIVAVFDPARIRSPDAAFDPDQRRNPNILAGLGAGAIGLGALAAPQDALAAEQGNVPEYMRRLDGTIKSERGFLGPIQNKVSGRTMTEVSIGQPGSEEGFYPLLVPTLTPEEIDIISNMDLERDRPPMSIIQKARAHAMDRINQGLSPFYQDGEEGNPMALNDIDIFSENFSQLSPEAEALLSRSTEGMVMTPGGPVRADAGPTEAQALNFAGLMTGIGGVADLLGLYPQMPAEGVGFREMIAGETNPSLLENLQEGNYLDTGLQLLGAVPLVGAAAKAPRMISKTELTEFKNVLSQALERQDPNLRQLIDEHPTVVAAQARLSEIPETVDNPLYGTEEWIQNRQFIFGSGDGARVVTGYDEGVDELYEQSKRLAWEDDNIPYPGPVKAEGPKTAVIVLGPPASGKSSISNPIARKINATIIDSDEAKKLLPEYEGGVGANAVHQESKAIASLLEQAAIKEGDNLVIPTVGDNADKIRARISALKDAGYNVQLVDVVVPAEEAAIRMYNRFAGTGRIIPASYIRSVGDNPTQTYNLLREEGIADGYTRIDNSGAFDQPKPVREDTGELLQGTELRLQFEGGSGGNGRPVSRNAGRAPAGAGASSEAKRGIGSLNLD